MPEIREKIQDTNEMKEETLRRMKEEAGFSNGKVCLCMSPGVLIYK